MRILHITPEAPGLSSGGQIGVAQTIISIYKNNQIDYIGPKITDERFLKYYAKLNFLDRNSNIFYKIFDLLHGVTTTYYRSWKRIIKAINIVEYDLIVMDFTKFDFCLSKLKKKKIIIRVHNIEYDYARKDYSMNKSLKNFLVRLFTKRSEKKLIKRADRLVFLHEDEKTRIQEIYKCNINDRAIVIPLCIKGTFDKEITINSSNKLKMLITGSLWFGGNYLGASWIIKNVLPTLEVPYSLIIAGSRPNEELKNLVKNFKDVELLDSPKDLAPYFNAVDLYLAPIFDGAGMKVKIAEALSFALPVVGTSHSFLGYKITNKVNAFVADTCDEFSSAIREYYYLSVEEKLNMKQKALNLYKEKYDISVSESAWMKMFEGIKI